MIRNSRRVTALAIAGALTLAPAVTGCGAGANPETARPTQLTEGVNISRTGLNIQLRNVFVLGPADGQTLAAGASTPLYGTLINSATDGQTDKLVGISSNVSGQPTPLSGGGLALPAGQAVKLDGPAGPQAVLSGLTKTLVGGENIEVALQFERAGVVKVTVPVVPQRGDFQTYAPAPTPAATTATPSPAATAAGKKQKKTKKPASPTPTITPTA